MRGSNHRRRGHVILIVPGGVFEEGLVEIVCGTLGVGDGEDVFDELEFQRGAGGGEVGAGAGVIAFGFHLADAGGVEGGLERGELGEQFGAELGFVFVLQQICLSRVILPVTFHSALRNPSFTNPLFFRAFTVAATPLIIDHFLAGNDLHLQQ